MSSKLIDKIAVNSSSVNTNNSEFENIVYNEGYDLTKSNFYIQSAKGAYIEDINSHTYIDMSIGAGSNILGHTSDLIIGEVKEQIDKGTIYTIPNLYTHKLTKILKEALPHFDGFVYCNSGSEATLRAMRIARAYTSRSKVAIFSGSWHGTHDNVLVSDDFQSDKNNPKNVLLSDGIPNNVLNNVVVLPYNEESTFDKLDELKDELAMILIEPSQGSNPRNDMKEFLNKLRSFCTANNILLGFDEIITGFRVAFGGAQEYYGIEADIATYGKTIGGGFPVGLIAGKKVLMDCIREKGIYMGGTYSANPITMCAGYSLMKYISLNKDSFYSLLNKNGNFIKDEINKFCINNSIPVRVFGIGSMFRLIFTDFYIRSRWDRDHYEISQTIQQRFYGELLENGIYVSGNRILFLSKEHDEDIINKFISVSIEALNKMKNENIF